MKLGVISGIAASVVAVMALNTTAYGATERSPINAYERSSEIIPIAYHKRSKAKRSRYRRGGFPSKRRATGNTVFIFSPRLLMWAAYDSRGNLVRTGRASGGAGYCRDVKRACRTPRGVFRIISKRGPGCRSSRYPLPRGGAPMPYCMFFSKYYAIHGSPNVPRYNASHGCIRVLPSAARWLSRNFIRRGTTVIVRSY